MATFSQMVDEVTRKLSGFTLRQDRQTHLTAALTASATSISVGSAVNISTGIIQIDDELIFIDSFDRTTGTLSVPPYGRGYNGTNASSHVSGAKVVISPSFPTLDVKAAINETVLATFPDLYATGVHTFTYQPARSTYSLPNEVYQVLGLSFESIGPTRQWVPVKRWRLDSMANTAAFDSSKSITLISGIQPGRTVQVFYTAEPSPMQNGSDDFSTVTGLPESTKDVIVLGAQYRLVSQIDPGRLTFGSAESDQQSQIAGRSYGAGLNSAKYLLALYQQRLDAESRKLNLAHPTRVHYTN
jgi:hypothetical protein